MNWFKSQLETRSELDQALTERAYADLAASVTNRDRTLTFSVDDLEQADGAVIACLKYYGIEPGIVPDSINQIDERIDWLCRPTGTMRRKIVLEHDWYKQAFGAILGKLDTGEAVALLPYGVRGYYYLDPTTGKRVKLNAEVAKHLESEATLFYKPLPSRPLKVTDMLRFIVQLFDRSDQILIILAAAAVALVGLVPAYVNKVAFDTVIPSGQSSLIAPLGVMLLGTTIGSLLITMARNLIMARMSTKINVVTEAATFARVMSLPTSFFKQYSAGNLGMRIANITQIANMLTTMLLNTGLTALFAFIYVFQIGAFAPMLALPALVIVLVQAAITILGTLGTRRYEEVSKEELAHLSGTETALLNGIQKIKLAGAEDRAFAKWASGYATYAQATYNRPPLLVATPALVAIAGMVGTIVIYFLAGSAGVSIANYMAFNAAYGQITAAIMMLASMSSVIAQIGPMINMVAPILEATPETAEDKPSATYVTGGIDVSGVSFRYTENSPLVLNNLSFKVHPGEYVALVGKSGCGKSTIMRLLLGFEKPERGSIFYGPYDVQKVDLRSLRQHIGVVMQDGKLFMGDMASNITISTPTATLDDAWEAAEIAGIAEDIRKMPMGMQTIVTEGSGGVSGGQRQRLMIARAVCGKRRILMLDEATSALDNVTQKHVSDSLEALNCTRVVVAHRLSTVRHCDRILVVDGGCIAEEGTYDELIAKGGVFAELVKQQRLDTEQDTAAQDAQLARAAQPAQDAQPAQSAQPAQAAQPATQGTTEQD